MRSLFGPAFRAGHWSRWRAFLAAGHGLQMTAEPVETTLPADLVPGLLDQLAVEIGRRETLRALLRDRLRPIAAVEPDTLLDAAAVAKRLLVVEALRRYLDSVGG
jgi:hypothetical protein